LDYRYLVSKAFEILYQQTMIVVLILIINGTINNLAGVMIVYAVVFGLGHFPMIGLFGEQQKSFTRFYVVVAVGSAIVFPVLILRVNYGFVYSYVVHSIFYTFLAGWFWVRGTLGGAQ
jgi:hypothetical protein